MIKQPIDRVVELTREYLSKEDNLCGGSLHIVLSDGNLSNSSVSFCIEYAKKNNDPDGKILAESILKLGLKQRRLLYERIDA